MTNKVTFQGNDYLLNLFIGDCYENDNEVNDYFAINSTYNKSIVDWINHELGLSIEYVNYLNPVPYVTDDMQLKLHISDSDLNKLFDLNVIDDYWFNETTKVIESYGNQLSGYYARYTVSQIRDDKLLASCCILEAFININYHYENSNTHYSYESYYDKQHVFDNLNNHVDFNEDV